MFKIYLFPLQDITSSFGSLESVPDMSPDIDEELKDIVLSKFLFRPFWFRISLPATEKSSRGLLIDYYCYNGR